MKVSAVITAFNRRDYLPRAINSALAQTVPVNEVVVVDDGSTDGSAELVESMYGDRVRVIRQSNTGVSGARRRGVQEARGEWIAFLDSDDEWMADRNGHLLNAADKVPQEVAWVFGALRVVTDKGEGRTLFEEHGLIMPEPVHIFPDSLEIQYPYQFPMLQGSLIRRKVLVELDCFKEGLRTSEDLLASFQVACRYKFAAVPNVVGNYFRTSDLAASSLVVNLNFGADYHRARMMAFAEVIHLGHLRPWNKEYAASARALCQVLTRRGQFDRSLGWEQFKYGGYTAKGIAFLLATTLGPQALRTWDRCAEFVRQHLGPHRSAHPQNGLQDHLQAAHKSD